MVPVGHGAVVWRAIVTQEELAERQALERGARILSRTDPFDMLMSTVPEISVGKDGRVRYVEGCATAPPKPLEPSDDAEDARLAERALVGNLRCGARRGRRV